MLGAAGTSYLSVALGANWITTVGMGFSWTGWTLVLIALGMTAGYIAALLQDTLAEEWVARCIWGRATDQWGSIKREQETLNKILMGLSVEFDYSQKLIHNLGASVSGADNQFGVTDSGKSYLKEVRLRLLVPAILREKLQWDVKVYLHHVNNGKELVYSEGNTVALGEAALNLGGVALPHITRLSPDLTVVSIQAQMSLYPSSSATFDLYDDVVDGQLLISEIYLVR